MPIQDTNIHTANKCSSTIYTVHPNRCREQNASDTIRSEYFATKMLRISVLAQS